MDGATNNYYILIPLYIIILEIDKNFLYLSRRVGEGVSDYWNDMTWDDEPEEKKYDYDDQYDNVDDNDMNLNNWNGRRLDDLFQ